MIELQVLSKVLNTKQMSFLELNNITDDYFITYPEEYGFIKEHHSKYGNVPDIETFLDKFNNFELLDVKESDEFLISTFKEEYQFSKLVPVVQKVADLLQSDSVAAVEYLRTAMNDFRPVDFNVGTDIITDANIRFDEWQERRDNPDKFMLETGFIELDDVIGGYQRGEELVVIFARTGQGKTWVLMKSLQHIWNMGNRVGMIEPEMSVSKTGYRFDTLQSNISNKGLMRGEDIPGYKRYIDSLKKRDNPFIVATPKDFGGNVTVSKLRTFVESNELDILGIDGISYLRDERYKRGDNTTTQLTHISEDLMDLSIKLKIPILVVSQSNRGGVRDDGTPELENIRDSDGLAFNASLVLSTRQKDPGMEIAVKKNRNGVTGVSLTYAWDIDRGDFNYVPTSDDNDTSTTREQRERANAEYGDGTEVF
jgi:replicative DNA helicase